MTTSEPYQIMCDLESMGAGPRAAMVSVGAVAFQPHAPLTEIPQPWDLQFLIFPFFYARVDLQSCVDVGMEIDASTVIWWLKQSNEARNAITAGACIDLGDALQKLSVFISKVEAINQQKGVKLWSNGKSFDCTIIEQAYKLCFPKEPIPFKYWDCRDMRTKLDDAPHVARIKPMISHHALFDAIAQAQTIQAVFQALKS